MIDCKIQLSRCACTLWQIFSIAKLCMAARQNFKNVLLIYVIFNNPISSLEVI